MPPPPTRAPFSPLPFLSYLLDLTSQSRNTKATSSLHAHLLRTGHIAHPGIHTKLLSSYGSAGTDFITIRNLLLTSFGPSVDDPFQWNSVLSAFSEQNLTFLAFSTFSLMRSLGFLPDSFALCSVLTSSASVKDLVFGKKIHGHVWKSGWISSVFVGGALIDLYVKSQEIGDARHFFDEMPVKNVVCANALITGYTDMGLSDEGLALLRKMSSLDLEPDGFTLSMILRICADVPASELGMQLHAHTVRSVIHLERDVFVQSALVEMYGKCGLAKKARLVFDMAREAGERCRDVVLWTSMLNAYGRNGLFDNVIATFEEMLLEGTHPDGIAFVSVVSACSRMGRVSQGLGYFEMMSRDYKIVPWPEHYGCVMDLLCRAGEVERAWKFANEIVGRGANGNRKNSSAGSIVTVWSALLAACKDCGHVEIGKAAAERALELDPSNVGIYVELSNLYARAGMWNDMRELRESMQRIGMKKDVGSSWIELTSS